MARRSLRTLLAAAAAALALAGGAQAAGGSYTFDGGTRAQQSQVRAALNASAFNWSVVPQPVAIHIARGFDNEATPGNIWLDADLLDAGRFAWGIVQHEYAHQVDFFLLTEAHRAALAPVVGGSAWWGEELAHGSMSGERFASSIAWAYWPNGANSMKPANAVDEAGSIVPAAFRAQLATMIGVPDTLTKRAPASAR
jgi:hypothetical protein